MEPLASRIHPDSLAHFIGQEHLVGPGKPISLAIARKELFSFILWGAPGCGKTTLARIYASSVGAEFYELSAVDAGKDDIKRVIGSRGTLLTQKPRVLFVDEIHRFNKAQQDFLLTFVERGDITLIGATTKNPSFEVIAPLLSRCRMFVLQPLSEKEMARIITRTRSRMPRVAREWLTAVASGDARQALTVLDTARRLYGDVTLEVLKEVVQSRHVRYDKKGEEHYDTILCVHKVDARL
jgi:putative ATPase